MDTRYLIPGYRQKSQGIVLAKVFLGGEWQPPQVLDAPDLLRPDPRLFESFPVKGDTRGTAYAIAQSARLKCSEFIARKRFSRIPDSVFKRPLAHDNSMLSARMHQLRVH